MNDVELDGLYVVLGGFVVAGVATGIAVLQYKYNLNPGRYLANLLTGRKPSSEEPQTNLTHQTPSGSLDERL